MIEMLEDEIYKAEQREIKRMQNRNIIIFDLDGTVADCSHRLHHIQGDKKDWSSFFAACRSDTPISDVLCVMGALSAKYQIWIVSGRSDECREQTREWLSEHVGGYGNLLMRKEGDHRPDDVVKEEFLTSGAIPKERVSCVFDDRKRVVDMWRRHGLTCFQVADGDF
jgi:hypothetical protein